MAGASGSRARLRQIARIIIMFGLHRVLVVCDAIAYIGAGARATAAREQREQRLRLRRRPDSQEGNNIPW
jgi:hypothetical protein